MALCKERKIIEFRVSSLLGLNPNPTSDLSKILVLGLNFFICHVEMIIASISLDVKIKIRNIKYMSLRSLNSCSQS